MSFPSSPDPSPEFAAASLAIHLDLVGGIAGDMFIAAMIDALPALEPPIVEALAAVRPKDAPMPAFETGAAGGLRARRFAIPAAKYRVASSHRAHDGGVAYTEIRGRIEGAPLEPRTRDHALALLALLAEAEASVHGTTIDRVHFHELADWHSLMDVVAAGSIAANLEGAHWSATAPPLGGGEVSTAHGALPVPAPATCALLVGYPWHDDGLPGERVTPTGAAIVRHLVAPRDCGARRVGGRLRGVGIGAGKRTLPGKPNVVRALVFERAGAPVAADADADVVAVLEFDIDDMTAEEIAHAAERLRAVAGVLDVSLAVRMGKKGRTGTEFRVLAQQEVATAVAHACFNETSTLGLRVREDARRILRRTEVVAQLGGASISVKVASRPDGARTGKAAHDDLVGSDSLDARRRSGVSAVRQALEDDA